jgi:hypothetical protein
MATKRRRKSALEEERMTPANIERVIKLLEPKEEGVKPITKKDACQILGMAYNTTRLGEVIAEYRAKKQRDQDRRAENRGKPATKSDIQYVISSYLDGKPVSEISNMLYRSPQFVNRILQDHSVPIRQIPSNYWKPELVPETAQRDRFKVGEIVYSVRYDNKARIEGESYTETHGWVYRVWLLVEQQFAYQPAYDLASLEHIRELGVSV